MRLTIDHLRRAPQFTNALLQREIDLRGLSISMLDESALSLLENKFDVINLTANALTTLQYFPLEGATPARQNVKMNRVNTLIVHRNKLHSVNIATCVMALPSIGAFLADRNQFSSVESLLFLRFWPALTIVSIQDNPVLRDNPENMTEAQVRAFLIYLCPKLKLINWQRVTQHDRKLMDEQASRYEECVTRWTITSTTTKDDKEVMSKTRKRGRARRDNVEGQQALKAEKDTGQAGDAKLTNEAFSETLQPATVADAGDTQAKLDAIEARILADDVTAEEIVELEQQMNELTAQLEKGKHRRLNT